MLGLSQSVWFAAGDGDRGEVGESALRDRGDGKVESHDRLDDGEPGGRQPVLGHRRDALLTAALFEDTDVMDGEDVGEYENAPPVVCGFNWSSQHLDSEVCDGTSSGECGSSA